MKSNIKSRVLTLTIALVMIISMSMPVYVFAANDTIEFIFTDVTSTNETTLSGEAKIKVSVRGAGGDVNIAQTALKFDGELKYKSIQFLKGENNPGEGNTVITPNAALANNLKKLNPSIIWAINPVTFTDDETDLFILTFSGEPGEEVTVSLDSVGTYFNYSGTDVTAFEESSVTVAASTENNEGKEAVVKLTMDALATIGFGTMGQDYKSSNVELRITSETKPGYSIYTVLNNVSEDDGGHRIGDEQIPTFVFSEIVLANDTYTVEISGIGYKNCVVENVDFEDVVEITNKEFVPGDVDGDRDVDSDDKQECREVIDAGEYRESCDFDRDGEVTEEFDYRIFDTIELPENPGDGDNDDSETNPEAKIPAKMEKPELDAKSDSKINVSWEKPADNGSEITGYIIKYGTDRDNLSKNEEISKGSVTETNITGLKAGTKYYFAIAAINAVGQGELSDIASESTKEKESSTGGGGGGGVGGGGGGSVGSNPSSPGVIVPATPSVPETPSNPDEPFVDLGNHEWAKDSVYLLKNEGIISGISATEYAPANNIKRGDFMLILTRMLGINNEFDENFADVPSDMYYYTAIGSARAAGIATGDGVNFMPEDSITRQDLITLAYRAFLNAGYIEATDDTSVLDSFGDKALISDYAISSMASMVNSGIIKGSDGNVNPLGNATRAEVAVMCARLFNLMN